MPINDFERLVKDSLDFVIENRGARSERALLEKSGKLFLNEMLDEYKKSSNPDKSLKLLLDRGEEFCRFLREDIEGAASMSDSKESEGLLNIVYIGKIRESVETCLFSDNTIKRCEKVWTTFMKN